MITLSLRVLTPAALALLLSACAATTPQADARFGQSVRATLASQVAQPAAVRNANPVSGVDGHHVDLRGVGAVVLHREDPDIALAEGRDDGRPEVGLLDVVVDRGGDPEPVGCCSSGIRQVADVPGRCEPGTGEINYPAIAKALRDMGFSGTVGMEAWAAGDSVAALEAFRSAFSI